MQNELLPNKGSLPSRLRAIASAWNRRFKDLVVGHWAGLFAPKGTPTEILEKMNAAVNKAGKSPELRARLIPQGIDPQVGSREDFRKFLAAEKARFGPVAQAAQMQAD